ncbi:MAG: beta-lactamase family protein [Kordiimonadaceae bacterium]|nr:beta-lactamase family protein [Kordiimonadaceae bacterium]MBO6567704.1 beta-lactamase family protein [Kordiimonadaceae bacterium]MBO6963082.1 beta-lactamase family protein [Kordiimonadaceae bacterium]
MMTKSRSIAGTAARSLFSGFTLFVAAQLGSASSADDQPSLDQLAENLRPRVSVGTEPPRYTLADRMARFGVAGVAIAVLEDGKILHSGGFGVLQAGGNEPVNADTLFSVGSVSKVATATMLMKMQAQGLIDMDTDIRDYLKSWELPASDTPITLRMILSHTAGFNVHGFGDFLPGAELPTVYDTLNGTSPATHGAVRFVDAPGSRYRYSGGGYTVAQLVATDVAGKDFPTLADELLFAPLGMDRSSFANPLPTSFTNVAKAHNRSGEPVALPRGYEAMPEMAASGLWTSANELGAMVAALIESYRTVGGYLPQADTADMMTKVSPSEHGMGPRLEGSGMTRMFHHGGANNSYRAWIEGHLVTGNGLVVLTNGTNGDDLFLEIRNAAADVYGWNLNQPVSLAPVPSPDAMLASYAGKYEPSGNYPLAHRENMIGWIYDRALNVSYDEGKLYAGIEGSENRLELTPSAPNRFVMTGFDQRIGVAELVFHRGVDASTSSMTLELTGAQSFYQRVPASEGSR